MMTLTPKRKRFLTELALTMAVGVIAVSAFAGGLLFGLQQRSADLLFQAANLRRDTVPSEQVAIVTIDDKSLSELGRLSSWSRELHSQLVEKLVAARARVIVFDVLFAEPTPADGELAATIRNAGNVILPFAYTVTHQGADTPVGAVVFSNAVRPLGIFEESAAATAHANMLPDHDGVVRELPLVITHDRQQEPSLALTAVAAYLRRNGTSSLPVENGRLLFAGRAIPLTSNRDMIINYLDKSASPMEFPTISYADVIRGDSDLSLLEDKIVIIGATSTGLGDSFWTPLGRLMYGVELHARAMQTILSAGFLRPAPSLFTAVLIFVLALLSGLAVLRLRIFWAAFSVLTAIFLYFLTAFFLFDTGIVMNLVYPPIAIAGAFVTVNLYNLTLERSEKSEITRTFGRYVSTPLVSKILDATDAGSLKLVGEEVEMTALFADARGFTTISEKMPTPRLVGILNRYLSLIIRSVLLHEGMVNKFGGDSIMAIWNTPVDAEAHALLAVKAAISAQQAIRELQESEPSLPRFEFGIGINTGLAVAGNMGSEDRLEFSVIGDAVNVAARLSDVAPGGAVWIGKDTLLQVRGHVRARPLEPLVIKGKQEPVPAYEILLDEPPLPG
ncbi:MAG: adenylate/guanylate cyclase domain-containing protein [Chloroflexota bacterium]